MIKVTVRIVKGRKLNAGKDMVFMFHTQAEANAFTSGLRTIDGLKKNERMLDAIIEDQEKKKVPICTLCHYCC